MPRRSGPAADAIRTPHPGRVAVVLRNATRVAAGLLLVFGGLWLYWTLEEFLLNDERFILQGPPDLGISSEFFRIDGAVHASEQQISNIFGRDFGRSVYLLPIEERRRGLLAIDWVKDARINRFWPNRVVVRIMERSPIAFVQVTGADNRTMYTLIDGDGVLLEPQRAVKLALPVLAGIPNTDTEEKRRERIRRFLRLQTELGPYMDKVSEIDVGDLENIKITQRFDNRALTLMLGNQKFKQRLDRFLDNYEQIRSQMPNATVLDLRLQGRITAVGGTGK